LAGPGKVKGRGRGASNARKKKKLPKGPFGASNGRRFGGGGGKNARHRKKKRKSGGKKRGGRPTQNSKGKSTLKLVALLQQLEQMELFWSKRFCNLSHIF